MRKRIPGYVRRARNKAKVTINGKTHYLPGEYQSEESVAEYERLIAEHLAKAEQPETANVTFRLLAVAYMKHCDVFYVDDDGRPSGEIAEIRRSLLPLLEMYGREKTNRFGPKKLKLVRDKLIDAGLYRRTINDRVSRIVRMLSWGVEEEYIDPNVVAACREVRNLQEGRCGDVPEGEPVRPADLDKVKAVRDALGRVVGGMVDLELLTGMRPQEVRNITWGQIEKSDPDAWCYSPVRHKTKRKGKSRKIFIGPAGQAILMNFLKADPDTPIFSPAQAEEERNAERRANRKSPMTPSQATRRARAEKRRSPASCYTKDSYRRAIVRACERVFGMPTHLRSIPSTLPESERERLKSEAKQWRAENCWTPNQLRHACGTHLRSKVGLDGARTVLGHSEKRTTEIYAEQDFEQAKEIMKMHG